MGTWLAVHSIDSGNNTGWLFSDALLDPNTSQGSVGTLGVSQEININISGNTLVSSTSSISVFSDSYASFIEASAQKLVPGAIVDLFELDYSSLVGGEILYFHGGVNGLGDDVVWGGITYTRYPIDAEGFERSSSGIVPRPKIKVANIMGNISSLSYQYQDLVGSKLTRRRTFVKYLDAVNFPGGINYQADPNVAFPDEVWTIDRKSSENAVFVEFELSAAFDVMGVLIPRRHCIQNTCTWAYRSAECGYIGLGGVATKNDVAITGTSGTYSRVGTTVTVTAAGTWVLGNSYTIESSSGNLVSGVYTISTGGSGTFIFATGISGTTSGNCIIRSGSTSTDKCGKRLSSCKLRFGTNAELPFGAFPGVGLMK